MKCNHCGANFKTTDLKCPYCGSFNVVAEELNQEKKWYEKIFFNAKEEFRQRGIWITLDKIVNRVLLIIGVLFIVILFVIWLLIMIEGEVSESSYRISQEKHMETMEEYHDADEWYELYQYMNENNIPGEDFYTYQQAGLLANSYKEYMIHKMCFLDMSEQEKLEDDFYLEYALKNSYKVYTVDMGNYDELDPRNAEHFESYQNEIVCFWKYTLGLTDAEIEELVALDSCPHGEELNELLKEIKSRGAWENE